MISPAMPPGGRPPARSARAGKGRPAAIPPRAPGCHHDTEGPTASITPAGSCPGVTTGSGPGRLPSIRCTSDRQTPHACTRTSTSCRRGSGTGTSTRSSRLLAWSNRAARTWSDRRQLRCLIGWAQLLVVRLMVEPLEPPGEVECVARPDRRVAAVLVEVPALAAAGVPHRQRELALQHLVIADLHVGPDV